MSDLLTVVNVSKYFTEGFLNKRRNYAVDNVSLSIAENDARVLTIAGESGSGKTTLSQMILGFLKPDAGRIEFKQKPINKLGRNEWFDFRKEVQAIFQNPFEAFNPFYKIDRVLKLPIRKFGIAHSSIEEARIIEESLKVVRLDPKETLGRYPHQLSGGQLQRLMIARALVVKPKLIIADEPVSMIDVSLRAIVLDIMMTLKRDFGISFVYITHDLSTALQISDDILILYRGVVVEKGKAVDVIQKPQHPYTQLLVQSIPQPDPDKKWIEPLGKKVKLEEINAGDHGCKFYHRCMARMNVCKDNMPEIKFIDVEHQVACHLYDPALNPDQKR